MACMCRSPRLISILFPIPNGRLVDTKRLRQILQLFAVGLAAATLPRTNQGRCNTHFCRQVVGCEIFLDPFNFDPIGNRLYVH